MIYYYSQSAAASSTISSTDKNSRPPVTPSGCLEGRLIVVEEPVEKLSCRRRSSSLFPCRWLVAEMVDDTGRKWPAVRDSNEMLTCQDRGTRLVSRA